MTYELPPAWDGRVNSLGFAKPPAETRVVAAMSGGVDSSVVAAMLKAQGYDVIGITLQLYDHGAAIEKKGACCAGQDIHDARNVSDQIGIPHYVLDYESKFREQVMEDFADTYLAGSTPIPCIRCNQTVKFSDLLKTARDLGADCLATGHYIRRTDGDDGPELHRAADASRDQSYFLFATTAEQLDYLRFPLGDLPKTQVRELADQFNLPVASKPDSQDICFVPEGSYATVVEKLRPGAGRGGDIEHLDGRVLGQHNGVIHYTIGQRRGLGVATGDPLYVVKIDAPNRRVIVGPREALMTSGLLLEELNWLGEGSLQAAADAGVPVLVRVRSTRPPVPARLGWSDGVPVIWFDDPEEGVARGQAAVLYDAEGSTRILGGGFILKPIPADERVVAA
ncbi:MAG: tRNA 2-thiouridine(34) synthase MnmA [Hyphomonas sp.]|jgi:tRNA-specific 2-thiouridylase|uniref:tRNA-5-taurinomethyluridine 2-sulfurtransferase n=5 Tax=root TaxID=1 RepID=A0A7S0VQX8_9CRYP|nr:MULTISPECIES: tRNA 2-thiouridine(34) synthase MnmA [unclassified Hyphomonas]KCZ65582.1 thiouridylase [Hyphomonas sp. L-53-1-40]MBG68149.1 tRNA 2-thiouridine(34) synthase MnmA [Hyphomonas sp.]MBO6583312.1 tRNA 2-thiouridine(34) synthase MnmA [Hyphomonas sp.]MDF1805025.1 tRNA 2-thiouridine(34) synthase MnmA [Hyphomonas sp.]QSR21556.1 tRNA(5-methylaminomethyl-2-thiouridine)-methyltransferase [Hyphomonas sp. KY3]|mmetsp:Transcript_24723/g.62635  ORF Transcript_24723/g.62635 Transcript_24723/m.62635 type:complete len:395 (+) Transcript_24723:46-1230(+)